MDDITVYGGSFKEFLGNLETVLDMCIEKKIGAKLGKVPFYGKPRNCVGTCHIQQGD